MDEERLCRIIQAGSDELLARAGEAFLAERCWLDGLRAVAYEMARFFEEDLARARAMAVETLSAGKRAQAIRDQGMAGLIELIDLGRGEMDDPSTVTRATAEGLAGAIYNRIHFELASGREEGLAWMVPDLMHMAVLPYLGEEAARRELSMPPPLASVSPSGPRRT